MKIIFKAYDTKLRNYISHTKVMKDFDKYYNNKRYKIFQYTTINDKNNKMIFDEDLVHISGIFKESNEIKTYIGKIFWSEYYVGFLVAIEELMLILNIAEHIENIEVITN